MSVINQVLNDIEKRNNSEQATDIESLEPLVLPESNRKFILLALFAGLVMCAGVALFLFFTVTEPSQDTTKEVVSVIAKQNESVPMQSDRSTPPTVKVEKTTQSVASQIPETNIVLVAKKDIDTVKSAVKIAVPVMAEVKKVPLIVNKKSCKPNLSI